MAKFWNKVKRTQKASGRHPSARRPSSGVEAIEDLVVEEIEVSAITAPRTGPKARRRGEPEWLTALKFVVAWAGLWMLPVLAALFARSPWPLDETRTLAVAWEMWLRGGALVPYLNGELYTQPPLLFWLINLGWGIFGVNEWWPRLVPALFGLATLFLIERLANRLWRRQTNVAHYAPLLMLGMLFWAFYLTLSLADMLLVFFNVLGAVAILEMRRSARGYGWILLGLVLGIGPLASGPTIFLYLAPLILTGPLWSAGKRRLRWGRWYGAAGKAVVAAAGIIAVWVFALTGQAAPVYVEALFTAPLPGPTLALFAVERPWWWYLAMLAVVTLPWSIFPLIWMRLWHIRREKMNTGMAFCLFWSWPVIVILSLLGIKQPQFLLPLLPAFALGMAYLLLHDDLVDHGQDSMWSSMAFPLILLGGLIAAVPGLPRVEALPAMLWEQRTVFIGMTVAGIGVLLAWLPVQEVRQRITNIAVGGIALLVLAILGIGSQFDKLYGVNEVAQYLAGAERRAQPIAHVGPYDGQFHFAGRLRTQFEVVDGGDALPWSTTHPGGIIVTYTDVWQPHTAAAARPAFEAAYRDRRIRIWETRTVTATP